LEVIFREFGTQLPAVTQLLLGLPRLMPLFIAIAAVLFIGIPILWQVFRMIGWDRAIIDYVVLPMPLIGSVLRRNLVARWCDAVRLGVQSGLDLPAAMELAGEAVGSPLLRCDGYELSAAVQAGETPDRVSTRMLPATVAAAMTL